MSVRFLAFLTILFAASSAFAADTVSFEGKSVKMIIPMVIFIMPALFVAILGPAVSQISQAFK